MKNTRYGSRATIPAVSIQAKYTWLLLVVITLSSITINAGCSNEKSTHEVATSNQSITTPPTASQNNTPTTVPAPNPAKEILVPSNYTTYIAKNEIFSISYPKDWKIMPFTIGLFGAGYQPPEGGYNPTFSVILKPELSGTATLDEMIEKEAQLARKTFSDVLEVSRIKTLVDGKDAAIIRRQYDVPTIGRVSAIEMIIMGYKTEWVVTCGLLEDKSANNFDKWEKDFNAIVRSLRILK